MRGKHPRIAITKVEALANKLSQLPPLETREGTLSKLATIRMLSKHIRQLQQRGYELAHIAEILTSEGVAIAPNTLSVYLQQSARTATTRPTRRPATKAPLQKQKNTHTRRPVVGQRSGRFELDPDTEDI